MLKSEGESFVIKCKRRQKYTYLSRLKEGFKQQTLCLLFLNVYKKF